MRLGAELLSLALELSRTSLALLDLMRRRLGDRQPELGPRRVIENARTTEKIVGLYLSLVVVHRSPPVMTGRINTITHLCATVSRRARLDTSTIRRMESLFPPETAKVLDEAQQAMGLQSDYALAQALKWNAAMLSKYRSGRHSMSLVSAAHFSRVTGIPLERIALAAEIDQQTGKRKLSGSEQKAA